MSFFKKIIIAASIILVVANSGFAQNSKVTKTIQVSGNCEMCKTTIEEAVWVKGVKKGRWDLKTKVLNITFDSLKISENEIHKLIAAEGYDTEKLKAADSVYNKLPECCLYRTGPGSMSK